MVHLDNASLRNSRKFPEYLEQFRTHRIMYPTYSTDLAQVISSSLGM
jgi:hypothetical protein